MFFAIQRKSKEPAAAVTYFWTAEIYVKAPVNEQMTGYNANQKSYNKTTKIFVRISTNERNKIMLFAIQRKSKEPSAAVTYFWTAKIYLKAPVNE